MGAHPTVCRLMRGVFNVKPPAKPLAPVWDVEQLLSYMDAWGASDSLPLLHAAYRSLLLLLLTSAARISEIADLVYPPSSRQPHEWDLRCPLTALTRYVALTAPHRHPPGPLFLTTRRPFRPASKDTLARWVKSVLSDAGINARVHTAHSTRAASTTAVHLRGVQVPDIMQTAQWTKASTFYNHYYRPSPPSAMSSAVLGSQR
ncbi:uncharacterized protein LOC100907979 [Galendromus occidentalis]|uniref:Uncharacterized protein LOC100907979 n=1 Tax=Galendromus occidentalis TaxID=34638 RepID=A0AAJ6QQK4_9ACAR|nr:uncharacterized protein LOC100907979 [Galendromus occidentalis]